MVGVVAVVALASLLVPGIAGRAGSLANPTEGTAGGRLELMAMGLAAVGDHPVFGWGPDQSRPAMHAQIDRGFEAEYGDDRVEDRAHDVFIDLAVWAGVPAAASSNVMTVASQMRKPTIGSNTRLTTTVAMRMNTP